MPMPRAIVIPEPQLATVQDIDVPPLAAGQLRVRTRTTLLSTGTEGTIYGKRFAPGTHWDRWFGYPSRPGYCCVAEVTEVGKGVESESRFPIGTRVVAQLGHASEHVTAAGRCTPIPEEVTDEQAAWFALAKVAFVGADVSGATLGSRVLVVGAGPVGQMAIRWLAAEGAYVVAADRRSPERLALATAGGAAEVLDGDVGAVAAFRDRESTSPEDGHHAEPGPFDVVVDSTGNPDVFQHALRIVADHGRVVVLGDAGNPAEQRLSPDLITRGLSVVGAHGNHVRGEREQDVRNMFFRLVCSGRFPTEGLITHRFTPEQCQQAYDLTETRRSGSIGILFDWTD